MYQSDKVQSMVDQLSRINPFYGREGLADPPRPDEKSIPRDVPSREQMSHIQRQLDLLTYNHLPHTFFNLEKHRAVQSILMTGREVLAEALPIRCLEATFVGMHLTQENKDVDRIPLSFRSCANGNHYQHIVLVVHLKQPTPLYGALGLSRKRTLMYKPLGYHSLYEIVMDYKREYEALGHELIDIKFGLSITHEPHCRLVPCWRFVALKLAAFDEPYSPASAPAAPATHPTSHQAPALPLSRSNGPAVNGAAASSGVGSEGRSRNPRADTASPNGEGSRQLMSIAALAQQRDVHPTEPIHEPNATGTVSERAGGSPTYQSPTQVKLSDSVGVSGRVSRPVSASCRSSANTTPVSMSQTTNAADAPARDAKTVTPPPVIARATSPSAGKPPTQQPQEGEGVTPPSGRAVAAREELPPLAQFLSKFSRLLPVVSEQYYKGLPLVDHSNRNAKLCFMSLEEAERDAKMENARRIELISKLQSPLSLEARRIAANRQLKSERGSKHRSSSRPRPGEKSAAGPNVPPSVGGKRAAAAPQKAGAKGSGRQVGSSSVPNSTASATGQGDKIPDASSSLHVGIPRLSGVVVRAEAISGASFPGDAASVTTWDSPGNLAGPETSASGSPHNCFPMPPAPRNDTLDLSLSSSLSPSSSSIYSDDDDDFLMDRSRAEGGS